MKLFGNGIGLGAASLLALTTAVSLLSPVAPARAERIANPVAQFAGIDKITGRITSFDVYVNETVQFGALQVTPKVCYSRDETEAQKIDAFIEVDEITLDRKIRRIFSGWMFADSPALNAVEHAIYDVWLTGCKQSSDVPAPEGVVAAHPAPVPVSEAEKAAEAQKRAASSESQPQPTVSEQPQPAGEGAVAPAETAPAPQDSGTLQPPPPQDAVPPLGAPQEIPDNVPGDALPPLGAPQEIPENAPGDALPPLGEPQPVPDNVPGDLLPPLDIPQGVEEIPEGQPMPQAPVTQPGGVGLF